MSATMKNPAMNGHSKQGQQAAGADPSANAQAGANPQRDTSGRFLRGNKGGPGNPYARQTAALLKAAADSARPEDMAEVMKMLLEKAKGGDVAAARLWMAYSGGKARPAADPDTLDAHELQ